MPDQRQGSGVCAQNCETTFSLRARFLFYLNFTVTIKAIKFAIRRLGSVMFKSAWVSVSAALLSAALVACGGAADIGSGTGAGTGTGTGTGTVPATPAYSMGTLNGATFTPNAIQINSPSVGAGGSTGLRVDIVDTANNNQLVSGQAISVSFSSPCSSNGQSSITSPVITATGSAASTYSATGCSGSDAITATATFGGVNLVASGAVTVAAAPISGIQFTSVSPNAIRIKGTGNPQTAVVIFTASNTGGGPVPNQQVKFSLDTTAGGITLSPTTGTTDSTGKVQTTVAAGTVATTVRVTATAVDAAGSAVSGIPPAQSDSLVISTGLADQNSFSISAACFNIEGGDYDGTTTSINILAADRFNNPVPDNTAIAFRTEGGQISSQCLTTRGGCSVNFTSASPRTADHRVTVLATATGEESFVDTNGNGQYDSGEAFTDLPEAFLDKNESTVRDGNEEFVDFNNNGNYDPASGNFSGVLCKSGCDTATSVSVRADLPITMSGSTANLLVSPSTVDISNGPMAVQVTMGDSANQPMPFGTVLSAVTSFGTIVGDASYTQACSSFNGPFVYTFVLQPPDNQTTSKSGVLTIKATTPKGVVSSTAVPVNFTVGGTTTPPPAGNLQSLSSVSANPTLISIRGTGVGLPESSLVTFKVVDDKGNALSGQVVSFSIDNNEGGSSLDTTSDTSDSNGLVTVNLNAGTVHTTVRVKAVATSGATTVNANSDSIVITTGIPDQDSFSIGVSTFNIEGENFDGVNSTITVRLADRFNNPAPDNTSVSFTTEGGRVVSQCSTSGGTCAVLLNSQNPRVESHRYTVLATAVGEESFTDLNGNGSFDAGEPTADLTEPFLDRNESGARDAGSEEFIDSNNNGVFDAPSGNFTGVLCNSGCDTRRLLSVRGSAVLVFSSSTATISTSPASLAFSSTGSKTLVVTVQDSARQAMAKGTTIAAATSYGTVTPLGGGTSYTQPDTTAPGGTQTYTFVVTPPTDPVLRADVATVLITVTSPMGVVSSYPVQVNYTNGATVTPSPAKLTFAKGATAAQAVTLTVSYPSNPVSTTDTTTIAADTSYGTLSGGDTPETCGSNCFSQAAGDFTTHTYTFMVSPESRATEIGTVLFTVTSPDGTLTRVSVPVN